MRNVNKGRIGIELPLLSMPFGEVHYKLAMVRNGAKDMVTKNKRVKKDEKYAQHQLYEAHKKIPDLKQQLQQLARQGPLPRKESTLKRN